MKQVSFLGYPKNKHNYFVTLSSSNIILSYNQFIQNYNRSLKMCSFLICLYWIYFFQDKDTHNFIARFCDLINVEINCDVCAMTLPGRRYRCLECLDFDLCANCYVGE